MKKYLLILLLIAIPFQYAWATPAVYCKHEKERVTHFGHHTHQHQTQTAEPDLAGKLANVHGDCATCSIFFLAPVVAAVTGLPPLSTRTHVIAIGHDYLSHIPAPPKMPNWPPVA